MLKNQIKIAFRNLWRQKSYAFINISGLSIGIASCILILLYVGDELSYDRYHDKADQIYRITTHGIIGSNEFRAAVTPAPMAETFVREIPGIIAATRIRNYGFPVIEYQNKAYSEERFFWADSTIFNIFTIPFLKGNPVTAINRPYTVVFTESMAEKYFGDQDPMGKSVHLNNGIDYMVTGVIEDFPENSHFHFDFIASLVSYPNTLNDRWFSNNFHTYVLVKENTPVAQIKALLPDFIVKYVGPQIQEATGVTLEQMLEAGNRYEWKMQPLTAIHLHSNLEHEIESNGNATYVYIFTLVAIAILAIACINFMNLATARSANRAREVGMRKTLGSNRLQLIRQFLTESIFLAFIALFMALLIVELILPIYNTLLGKQLYVGYFLHSSTIPYLLLFTIVVGLLAGSYPAFYISSFQPVVVLRGNPEPDVQSGKLLRSGLVIFQISVSIALIVGTFIVSNQLNYIQNKELGFNKDQIIIVEKTDDIGQQIQAFKHELTIHPSILYASNSTHYIGQSFSSNAFKTGGPTNYRTHIIWNMWTDFDFAATYEVEIVNGRYYSREYSTDSSGIVLNEAAVRALGLDDPVGKEVIQVGPTPELSTRHTVIGVMKDFHFESLHYQIRPLAILPFARGGFGRYVSVLIKPENVSETLKHVGKTWKKFAGIQAFEYFFFDEEFAGLYASEQRTEKLMAIFSILAVFIACLGLFGLASFNAEKRTKEIGVRKALGASVNNIVLMLLKETTKLVVIAHVISLPIIYYIMHKWLQNFAYRTLISLDVFASTIVIVFSVAILAVSYQALKAAMTNPVDVLHYE